MKLHTLFISVVLAASAAAATITVTNGNFQSSGHNTNPTGWTVNDTTNDSVYVWANGFGGLPAGTNVAAIKANDGAYLQQAFNTADATAGSYNSYTVGFDYGWRSNSAPVPTVEFIFHIWNFTDNISIASQTRTFTSPTTQNNVYRVLGTDQTVTITYDNTLPGLTGDTIGLRVEMNTTAAANAIDPTAWIDNVSITAVPEPAAALLGGLGLLGLLRRRRY